MKRIFSLFIALMLVITMAPFLKTEANAWELEEEPTFTIEYKPGSGAIGSPYTEKFYDDEEAELPSPSSVGFKKVGYEFDYWKINGSPYYPGETFSGEGKYTATAQWVKEGSNSSVSGKTYKVTYYPGEAGGRSVSKIYDYDENFYLISNPFEYEKHKFEGWEYSSGDVYPEGTGVKAPNEDVSFTAVWKKDSGIEIIDGKKAIDSISIKTKPTKTVYKVGETLDTSGLSITVTYEDESTETVTSGFEVSPSGKLDTAGTIKITVTYKEQKATFNVTVNSESSSSSSSAPSSSQPKPSSSSTAPKPSSSSVPESSSEPESSSSSSSVPEVVEPDVFEPITLAFGISGDIPVTKIEFTIKEDIGENPQLSVVPLDGYSVTDDAAAKFIENGDALAAFDLSLLSGGFAFSGEAPGTVTYSLNGTQASAPSNYDTYVLAMVHTLNLDKYEGEYYMTDGENVYLYDPEADFKTAVSNIKLIEDDDVYRLVIVDPSGLSSFAYKASENTVVEVKLIPSAEAASASIDVSSLSPVMLVQIEVGSGKAASAGIPVWVWIVIAAVVLVFAILVVLFLISRKGQQPSVSERTHSSADSSSYSITGFDDEE